MQLFACFVIASASDVPLSLKSALDYLESRGHNLSDNYGLSVVQAISRKFPGGPIFAAADGRKDGGVDGINNKGTGSGGGSIQRNNFMLL